jgi:hypothetical protein
MEPLPDKCARTRNTPPFSLVDGRLSFETRAYKTFKTRVTHGIKEISSYTGEESCGQKVVAGPRCGYDEAQRGEFIQAGVVAIVEASAESCEVVVACDSERSFGEAGRCACTGK